MTKGRFATLTSWSYSVYTQYCKCPFSVYLDKIQRVKIEEPPNPSFIKGNRSHEIADTYIGGMGKKRPSLTDTLFVGKERVKVTMEAVKEILDDFRAKKARTEQEWAFTRDYTPTTWFGKDAWLRVKTDVCADSVDPPLVEIVDWKTGRQYDEHRQQRSLYALAGLQFVQIGSLAGGSKDVKLTAQHVYTDTGIRATEAFRMKDLQPLKKQWEARIKGMMSDTVFKPKTGFHCRHCRFKKSAGGPCPEDQ